MKSRKTGFSFREISPKTFLFTYDNQYDLCMSFVRMQEYYESPEFKGKYFTLEEFMDWWSNGMSRTRGSFDYPSRWNGFNLPGNVILNWLFICDEDVLRLKEYKMMCRLAKKFKIDVEGVTNGTGFYMCLKDKLDGVYVIGCHKKDPDKLETVDHELAHALYTLNGDYKKKCKKLLRSLKKGDFIYKKAYEDILDKGYDKSVIDDELQAYFSTGDEYGILQQFGDNFASFKKHGSNEK